MPRKMMQTPAEYAQRLIASYEGDADAAIAALSNTESRYPGMSAAYVAKTIDAPISEQTRLRDERHAANVAAMGDDVAALAAYFGEHGDTQSYDALERLGYWSRESEPMDSAVLAAGFAEAMGGPIATDSEIERTRDAQATAPVITGEAFGWTEAPEPATPLDFRVVLRWRGVVVGEMTATRVVALETARAHLEQFTGVEFRQYMNRAFAPERRNLERLAEGERLLFSFSDDSGAASAVITRTPR